jgi:hypothetical protein
MLLRISVPEDLLALLAYEAFQKHHRSEYLAGLMKWFKHSAFQRENVFFGIAVKDVKDKLQKY